MARRYCYSGSRVFAFAPQDSPTCRPHCHVIVLNPFLVLLASSLFSGWNNIMVTDELMHQQVDFPDVSESA